MTLNLEPTERSCHKVHSCKILPIKRYGQCQSFCGQKKTQTNGRAKNDMPPDLSMRGHKKNGYIGFNLSICVQSVRIFVLQISYNLAACYCI